MTKQQIWAVVRDHYPNAELLKVADIARLMNISETSARKAVEPLPHVTIGQTQMWWIKNIVDFLHASQEDGKNVE